MAENTTPSPAAQYLAVSLLVTGAALAIAGAILVLAGIGIGSDAGTLAQSIGILLMGGALIPAYRMAQAPLLRRRGVKALSREQQLHDWHRLKVVSILLNLVLIVAVLLVLYAAMTRIGIVQQPVAPETMARLIAILHAVIATILALAVLLSLRLPMTQGRTGINRAFHLILLVGMVATALGALLLNALLPTHVEGILGTGDAPLVLMVAYIYAGIDAFLVRSLPTLYVLLSQERQSYQGYTYFSKAKSVIAPTLIAFALLFVMFLLFLLFGAGFFGTFGRALQQPAFLILLGVIVVALVASVVMSFRLAQKEDTPKVYQEKKQGFGPEQAVLWTGIGTAVLLGIVAALLWADRPVFGLSQPRWLDFTALALLAALGPYGFYKSYQAGRIRRLEERFPDFLRDLASSHRGGLTLPASVSVAARGEYGPLGEEIKRMADQMSWNVSFSEAMQRFADRLKTPLVERAVSLIREAGRSGGSTSEVLFAAARDAREIKNLENERRLSMVLYAVVIYITFFVFLVVAAVMFNQFVPQLIASSEALRGSGAAGIGFQVDALSRDDYRAFYFLASVVQGFGSGIVAGMMSTGRAVLGLRHAFIMVAIAYVTFALFLI